MAYVDRRSQDFGGRWSRLKAFGGIRGSSSHEPLVADGVIYKPLVACVDGRVGAFGGIRGSSFTSIWWQMEPFTSLWWHTWIVVYKPLVVCVDRHPQALGGGWSHLQGFGGIRGSSCTCL